MAIVTITGTLTIPDTEPSTSGIYNDLTLYLFSVDDNGLTEIDNSNVSTSNTFSFTYDNTGIDRVIVKLWRISSDVQLSESPSRGVLPRSFLLPTTDVLYNTPFKTNNFLFDAGLSILACAGGRYTDLGKEITDGVIKSETLAGSLPFQVNHLIPDPENAQQEIRTSTVALTAYSLGYYLEKNPLASNKVQVAAALNDMLIWLCAQRTRQHEVGSLLIAGQGRMNGSTFDPGVFDNSCYTVDNILAYFAFKQAGVMLNSVYLEVSDRLAFDIKKYLYDATNHIFFTASHPGNSTSYTDVLELWLMGTLFFLDQGDTVRANDMINFHIEYSYPVVDVVNNVSAYKALQSDTKVWFEGSYAVAMIYYKMGNMAKYNQITKSLNKMLNDDGSYRWGVIKDGQTKVLDYKSVGSTAWGFIANQVPEQVFSINTNATLITGIVPVYINHADGQTFIKSDCPDDSIPSSVLYEVLAGAYNSTVSQAAADELCAIDIATNGQAHSDYFGTCSIDYLFYNTLRQGLFASSGCFFPSTGQVFPYEIEAGAYGSNISQEHANALADAYLFTQGQDYADAQGQCIPGPHIVNIWQDSQFQYNGADDDIYATVYAAEPVSTLLTVTYEYTTNGGITWNTGGDVQIYPGATNSYSFYVTTVPSGGGYSSYIRITNVTPSQYGYQLYNWDNNVTVYGNEERSAYFIKDCGLQGIGPNSIVLFTCTAGSFTSVISQDHANALADSYLAGSGPSYANYHGVCDGVTYYPNEEQSGTYQKQGCSPGYIGDYVTYVVPAGTYTSTISTHDANALAIGDVQANGQNYANTYGLCLLGSNVINVSYQPHVTNNGLFDTVRVKAVASDFVPATIEVSFFCSYNGTPRLINPATIPAFNNQSDEVLVGKFPTGAGGNVVFYVNNVTPNPASGTTFVY